MTLRDDDVAVIGLACRAPGARNLDEFWDNLVNGVESIDELSVEELLELGVDRSDLEDERYRRLSATTPDMEDFDARLFGMTPREAAIRDPQHRMFMECVYSALNHAGYDPGRIDGSVGVFGGAAQNEYSELYVRRNRAVQRAVGFLNVAVSNHQDYLATITSYRLGFTGPSISISTACSTSLVAIHMGCQSLRNGECDVAVAGGVEVELPYRHGYWFMEGSILSESGHVRPFDADADGTIFSSGGGVVVLKPLRAALDDGDTIYAVVRGSAVNNDGSAKAGFTAPGVDGQTSLIVEALADAEVDAESIGFVEAHGTGTAVGDPIELAALTRAFRTQSDGVGWCTVGSVKGNVGHLGPGAGVIGFIKAVLALDRDAIPPTANYTTPNPALELETTPFTINGELRAWPASGAPRRAGVSSFGIGGTNAHVILEEAPDPAPASEPTRAYQVLPLSALTDTAVNAAAAQLADHLESHPELDLADVAATLQDGRGEFDVRRFVVASSKTDAAELLHGGGARGLAGAGRTTGTSVAFLFSGQGSQYPGMGAGLYESEPVYRAALDRCAEILEPVLRLDVRTLLHAASDDTEAAERLAQTAITQPAVFAVEWALAELWASLGVEPSAMLGHSSGEYVAATRAGVFSLEDGLRLIAARGQLMQSCEPGSMLALPLAEDAVRPLLDAEITIAASNAPTSCVVSGPTAAIDSLRAHLAEMGIEGRPLVTSHAFHSQLMEPAVRPFADVVASVPLHAPTKPYISNVTGTWVTAEQACDPEYWALHLRSEVKFSAGVQELLADKGTLLLEVGPGNALTTLVRMHGAPGEEPRSCASSLRHPQQAGDDQALLLAAFGKLWASGLDVDWRRLRPDEHRRRVPLPPYPYERQRCWVDPDPGLDSLEQASNLEPKPALESPLAVPAWSERPASSTERADGETWLLIAEPDDPLGEELARAGEAAGALVVTAHAGHTFDEGYAGIVFDPESAEDCWRLLEVLGETERWPDRIVHALTPAAGNAGGGPMDVARAEREANRGFYSLLALVQALARRAGDEQLRLVVVTDSMQRVLGTEQIAPGQASVLGPLLVLGKEMPTVEAHSVDVVLAERPLAEAARTIVAEAVHGRPREKQVAFRDGRRWVLGYGEIPQQPSDGETVLRERGVYVISGGLGGLGLEVAHDFARRANARLVLLARRGLPPRDEWEDAIADGNRHASILRRLLEIEADGGEVATYAVDVTDRDAVARVIADVRERFGAVHGVVHAAGLGSGGMMAVRRREDADGVIAPKVAGTLALLEACGGEPDFFAGFASIIGPCGDFGQADYCAGNNVLDRVAHACAGASTYTVSIDWAGWSEAGMMVAPREEEPEPIEHRLLRSLTRVGDDEVRFAFELTPDDDWILDEHRFDGTAVLPGTGCLEVVRSALESLTGSSAIELADVIFIGPIMVPEAGEGRLTLRRDGDWWSFAVERADESEVRARGRARAHTGGEPPQPDLAEWREQCPVVITGTEMKGGVMTYGAHWLGTELLLHFAEDRSRSMLDMKLPDELADDVGDFTLQPSLLDAATGLGIADGPAGFLPFSYQHVVVHRPMGPHALALRTHRRRDTDWPESDVVVLDGDGNVCVEVEGYSMRRIDPDAIRQAPAGAAEAGGAETDGVRDKYADEFRIKTADGLEILHRILLARPAPQVVVVPERLERRIARLATETAEAIANLLAREGGSGAVERFLATPYVAPETELEQQLAALWGEALGVKEVGIDDDFFELGGTSLVAVQLLSRIRDRLNVDIGIAIVFESPTVRQLAAGIDRELVELVAGMSDEEVEQALGAVTPAGAESPA